MIEKQTPNNVSKIVKRGAKTGALIGLFGWICIFGILASASAIIIRSNPEYIPEILSLLPWLGLKEISMLFSSNRLFRVLSRLSLLLLILLATLPLIIGALGASISYLAHKIKLDPEGFGWSSLKWAFRSLFTWPGIALLLAIQTLIIVLTILVNMYDQLWMAIALLALAFCIPLVIPLIVCNTDTASISVSRSWWNPKWPGWKVFGVFLLFNVLNLIPQSMYSVFALTPIYFVFIPIFSIFISIITLFEISVLMSRSTRIPTLAKKIFHRPIIGPWIVYYFFFTLTFIIFLLPFFSANFFMIVGAPSVVMLYEKQGLPLPLFWRFSVVAFDFVKDYWYSFSLPGMLVYWLGATRLGWKIGLHKLP